jgi:hypothetical protein
MKQRKRVKKTKVSNEDAPLSNKEFLAWVDKVLSKPINPRGLQTHKKTDYIKREYFPQRSK